MKTPLQQLTGTLQKITVLLFLFSSTFSLMAQQTLSFKEENESLQKIYDNASQITDKLDGTYSKKNITSGGIIKKTPVKLKAIYQQKTLKSAKTLSKSITIEAGGLYNTLTPSELTSVTDLTISGTMDASDFQIIRDSMYYNIKELDLSNVTIIEYRGTNGTDTTGVNKTYPANTIPSGAFWNPVTHLVNYISSIKLPSTITAIGDYTFLGNEYITSLELPSSLTKIGEFAFQSCEGFTSITIPSSVTSIENLAFSYTNLETISIPSEVSSFGDWVFSCNEELYSATILSETTGDFTFYKCPKLKTISFSTYTNKIGIYAFSETGLESINIPPTISLIDEYAFSSNKKLESAVISADEIGYCAFDSCTALTNANILEEVSTIGEQAFYYCTELTNISVSNGVTSIGDFAFSYCKKLDTITLPNTVTELGDYAFSQCEGLKSITLPSSIETIQEGTFYECSSLINAKIPTSVKWIEKGAFYYCAELINISISNGVTNIGDFAFSYCKKLSTIVLPNSVTEVGSLAFWGCSNLESADLSSSLSKLEWGLFYECSSLKSIYIPEDIMALGGDAFYNCSSLKKVNIPKKTNSIGEKTFSGCTSLDSIYAFPVIPIDLTNSDSVFYQVDKTNCILSVPIGSISDYETAYQWQDFFNIVEEPGIELSVDSVFINGSEGGINTIELNTPLSWSVVSSELWLTISPGSGIGSATLTFTAEANPGATPRTATVTISAAGTEDITITITQEAGTGTFVNIPFEDSLSIYPNPVDDGFWVKGLKGYSSLKVLDINGRLLHSQILEGDGYISINSFIPKGIYIIKISDDRGVYVKKINKK